MTDFFEQLNEATSEERNQMLAIPFIQHGVQGKLSLDSYIAFLTQAYHHVKHTTPLLMACGSRIPGHQEWLRDAMAHYIEEEVGHQEWILNDIKACATLRRFVTQSPVYLLNLCVPMLTTPLIEGTR